MGAPKLAAAIVGGIVVACIAFVVFLFIIKALWAWTVPDLFPEAVKQGLVAQTISWGTAAKVALFLGVLTGLGNNGRAQRPSRKASKTV